MKRFLATLLVALLLLTPALAAKGSYTVKTGALTLKTNLLPLEKTVTVSSASSGRVAACGDHVFVLSDGVLLRCRRSKGRLKIEQSYEFPYLYTELNGCGTRVCVSAANREAPAVFIDGDGEKTTLACDTAYLAASPAGDRGISWVGGISVTPVNIGASIEVGTAMAIPASLRSINRVFMSGEHIFLGGISAANGMAAVSVCDPDGRELFLLGGAQPGTDGCMLHTLALAETDTAIVAFDSRLNSMNVYDRAGDYVDTFDARELFGTAATVTGCDVCADGALLLCAEDAGQIAIWEIRGLEDVPLPETPEETNDAVKLSLDSDDIIRPEDVRTAPVAVEAGEAVAPEMPAEEKTAAVGTLTVVNVQTKLNMRIAPRRNAGIIGKLTPGETVEDLGVSENGFRKVRYKGVVGYIGKDYLR